jgi:predicted MPP superfamily phosphohydrolase
MAILRPSDELRVGSSAGAELRAHSRPGNRRSTISRRQTLKALAAAGIGAVTGAGAYGHLYARRALELTRVTLPVSGLPPALNGLRIGFITDVHCSQWVSPEDIGDAVRLLMAEQPELVVLGGDYVTWGDHAFVGASAESLAPLSAPLGVFAILGNHDSDRDMPAALEARRIEVLKDARTKLTVRGEPLNLAGIRFWTRRAADIAAVVKGVKGTTILLAHDPRRLAEAASLNIPLMLSGHTHGGQVVLPMIGAIAARKFPVIAGVARRETTTLYVSRGIGTVYIPVRLNCPPEVALLTLGPAQSSGDG